jgi:fructose/tagatose bisphosphate aldolase
MFRASTATLYGSAQAAEFCKRTGADTLAMSIETAHGAFKYRTAAEAASLRFDILKEFKN